MVSSTVCREESELQHQGNLPTEAWHGMALLSQIARRFLNNLELCLTFPVKVPCPMAGPLLC